MQADVATPRQYTFKEGRGQVVCCLLAAHAMCQLPLDLDLTDGTHHHLLRLRGGLLLVYEGCTPKQVGQTRLVFLTSSLQVVQVQRNFLHILWALACCLSECAYGRPLS